jgi:Domain of Unknown Function (DUF928)
MTVQPTCPPAHKLTNKFARKLIMALLAACILPVALPMFPADAAPGYKPPRRQSAKRTENSGTRNELMTRIGKPKGCAKDLAVPLTLVVPEEQATAVAGAPTITPETTLEKPPLYVYLSAPKTLKVILFNGSTPVWTYTKPIESSGIHEIPYPTDQPSLEVGKTYSWNVQVVCESTSLDNPEPAVSSRVTRVALRSRVDRRIKAATTPRQRADIYATAGLWPETLMSIAEAQQDSTDTAADQDLLSLLEQIDLKSIADRERASNPTP